MIVIENKEECCGCSACESICPKGCIQMEPDKEGFWYPVVHKESCIDCGLCEKACPIKNVVGGKREEDAKYPKAYALKNKDHEIRSKSSSGGVFSLLAEMVLNQNGVVFGAVMTEDCSLVVHEGIYSIEELDKLRGSKYLQSNMGNCYKLTKNALEEGKKVLFSGTPCQIEGLKTYLGQEYTNLITVDMICHGTPSPVVWKKYVEYRENCAGAKVQQVSFRSKEKSWKNYEMLFQFQNGSTYRENFQKDLYMKAFLQDICLRPSCYACEFKKIHRESDITMADFWGCENIMPEMDDDKGTSLVVVHSKRGANMLEQIRSKAIVEEVEYQEIPKTNPSMLKSAAVHRNRELFFDNLENMSFEQLVRKYVRRKFTLPCFFRIHQL